MKFLPQRPLTIVLALLGLAVAVGAVFLAAFDIPAPSVRVERVIPNDRLPR
ncbi:MAG: hypothetical protein HY246_11020 [Proteobacteria bacterium]|nr:hypothetical protein [Pseudomonadota bacterium]